MLLQLSAAELAPLIQTRPGEDRTPLTQELVALYREAKGRRADESNIASWNNSIPVVVNALLECGLDAVEVQIEVDLPHTSSAVDLVLCGEHPGTGAASYLAIELKQVRRATVDPECPVAVDLGFGDKNKLHPVRQVQLYCDYMMRYLRPLRENEDQLAGLALLHNARDANVEALFDLPETDHGALYTLDDLDRFRRALTSRFARRSGARAAQALEDARKDPLRKVTELATDRPFLGGGLTLLDEQYIAFDRIMRHLEKTALGIEGGPKRVYILRGGPGSGKSAVALELQRQLGLKNQVAVLASGSRAYTQTLRELYVGRARHGEVARKRRAANTLYQYFNSFTKTPPDSIDVLICDEAHRVRYTSTDRWTPRELRDDDKPQVEELIRAAKVLVFLLDDHQSIRPDEVGTAAYLRTVAEQLGCTVDTTDLTATFRQGGSKRYQSWVQQLLGLGVSDPIGWKADGRMLLTVADSPEQVEQFVQERHLQNFDARITAGFCWPWSNPQEGRLVEDVRIGRWKHPWNVKPGHHVPGAPSASIWSTDKRGVNQVGCVYTAQTFEYDWNAVIIGPDLVFRDGKFVVDRSASRDPAFRGPVEDDVVERCIRNAYHVLLTRGIVGTLLYSPDPETQSALRRLVPGAIGLQNIPGAAPTLTAEGAPPSRPHTGKCAGSLDRVIAAARRASAPPRGVTKDMPPPARVTSCCLGASVAVPRLRLRGRRRVPVRLSLPPSHGAVRPRARPQAQRLGSACLGAQYPRARERAERRRARAGRDAPGVRAAAQQQTS
ncbi:DUF2075 domain-containing protein [Streptomyces beihaiensis]|uniref:DUF2075 domain-containing protein n=1 Tax=Streptomyces beihaiensis TaxID=2984495 RepID=A0ABT3U4G2_9ACTN|nr:DUF2075 domain-containing protein [Streptomyces beihaiensis]MCX3064217.1 DUF2075 domain-containing protein [Streptomyces beihaiensis]